MFVPTKLRIISLRRVPLVSSFCEIPAHKGTVRLARTLGVVVIVKMCPLIGHTGVPFQVCLLSSPALSIACQNKKRFVVISKL